MKINDREISKLLDRAENYRNDLAKTTDEIKIF